ncbi:hypothetical protein D7Y21_11850 [Corallococcus sp. AB045]|uniref:hypothetical protein n=1 Tax=Corallococcus sp. AB045 TaxID=2316719 RepID=UPI000EEE3E3E|nr:hypothetical protein [Corallococcus sp. AB045]RKH89102.1 hypothetical protein D7Y21_11850 [Corallococcus sp. AB045]
MIDLGLALANGAELPQDPGMPELLRRMAPTGLGKHEIPGHGGRRLVADGGVYGGNGRSTCAGLGAR